MNKKYSHFNKEVDRWLEEKKEQLVKDLQNLVNQKFRRSESNQKMTYTCKLCGSDVLVTPHGCDELFECANRKCIHSEDMSWVAIGEIPFWVLSKESAKPNTKKILFIISNSDAQMIFEQTTSGIKRRIVEIELTPEQVEQLNIKRIGTNCGNPVYENIESISEVLF